MRNKLKVFMFNSFLFYVIFIVILFIVNTINFTHEIELTNSDENNLKIIELKERINHLENSSCKSLLVEMSNLYEETSYDGNIELTDFYNKYFDNKSFLSFYGRIENECNIGNEEKKSMDLHKETLNSILYIENLLNKYMFQYEINFTDYYMHEIGESNIINLQYQLSKSSELNIIERILDYIGGSDE